MRIFYNLEGFYLDHETTTIAAYYYNLAEQNNGISVTVKLEGKASKTWGVSSWTKKSTRQKQSLSL